MAWNITAHHAPVSIDQLMAEYPGLVGYDESGFSVALNDLKDDGAALALADDGYSDRASRRLLFWADEASSEDDDGARAIAEATWDES